MNKIKGRNVWLSIFNILLFVTSVFFIICIWLSMNGGIAKKGYSFFLEFNNAHGIKEGTPVRMRGITVGYIKSMKMDLNSILVLVYINSANTFIPRNAIIETNQTGLLNDTVIDIIPLHKMPKYDILQFSVFSDTCNTSSMICHLDFLEGDRGLNYDDLVRAATRISQRFDDPNFFNVFYLFLQNSLEISDDMINITTDVSNLLTTIYQLIFTFLKNV